MPELIPAIEAIENLNHLDAAPEEIQAAHLAYLKQCGEVIYLGPEVIQRAQAALGRSAIAWAYRFSPVYRPLISREDLALPDCLTRTLGKFTVQKTDLLDKSRWFVPNTDASDTQTSGSTGAPFRYKIWNPCFPMIEGDRHYRLVLGEFGLLDSPRVLHLVSGMSVPDSQEVVAREAHLRVASSHVIKNFVQRLHCSHGGDTTKFWHIDFDEEAFLHIKDFCGYIVEFIEEHKINVVLAGGGFFELLTTFLIADESHAFPHLTSLLSNTGDRCNVDTLEFLVETGVADAFCDHMRCWDGGVGFFTCKHGVYHLTEELAYVFTVGDGKLGSVDFFNLASPFINYLNGDYGEITPDWKHCECGRWYRPFKFLNRRSRSNRTQGGGYYDVDEIHKRLKEKYRIQFVSFQDNLVTIEDSGLTEGEKKDIVLEMAKEQIAVHYFTQQNLKSMISMLKIVSPPSLPDG